MLREVWNSLIREQSNTFDTNNLMPLLVNRNRLIHNIFEKCIDTKYIQQK